MTQPVNDRDAIGVAHSPDVPTTEDAARLDANYTPFPSFAVFTATAANLATDRWTRASARLSSWAQVDQGILKRAREVATKAAAIETGAIEGLYEATDAGITFTAAASVNSIELVAAEGEENKRALIAAQLGAYEYVLDFATGKQPITEAWIRQLHSVICASQAEYEVWTDAGKQRHSLPKGEYKRHPNHVFGRGGQWHSYAPVDLVSPEMHRLTTELSTEAFQGAHPAIQAAYAHYAFICVHPFADGNGRVARALASVFTYRSDSVPLLILFGQRGEYVEALQQADAGDYAPFTRFIFARAIDAMELVADQIQLVQGVPAAQAAATLESMYVSPRGWAYSDIDNAAMRVLERLNAELDERFRPFRGNRLSVQVNMMQVGAGDLPANFRGVNPPNSVGIRIMASVPTPVDANVGRVILLGLPRRDAPTDDIVLFVTPDGDATYLPLDDIMSGNPVVVPFRIRMLAERIVNSVLSNVAATSETIMRGKGF